MALRRNDEPVPEYVLERFLGRGSLGDVWSARGPGGIRKALKFIRLERSGLQELTAVRRMRRIYHPHLLAITDMWLYDGEGRVMFDPEIESLTGRLSTHRGRNMATAAAAPETLVVAMTLADRSLAERLEGCLAEGTSGIPRNELLRYVLETAKALDFLGQPHRELGGKALQHCDIKPQNLFLVGGCVQVGDFGLVRMIGERRTVNRVEGTFAYMAPEVLGGQGPTSTTDQYSLAISYYQLLTGRLPFEPDLPAFAMLAAHASGSLDFSLASRSEQQVLRKATALNPDKRYPSARAFVAALIEASVPAKKGAILRPILTAARRSLAPLNWMAAAQIAH